MAADPATTTLATYGPWVGPIVITFLGTALGWVTLWAKVKRDNRKDADAIRNQRVADDLALEQKKLDVQKTLTEERAEFHKELRAELGTVREALAECEANRRADFRESEAKREADRTYVHQLANGLIALQAKYEELLKKMPAEPVIAVVPAASASSPVPVVVTNHLKPEPE